MALPMALVTLIIIIEGTIILTSPNEKQYINTNK